MEKSTVCQALYLRRRTQDVNMYLALERQRRRKKAPFAFGVKSMQQEREKTLGKREEIYEKSCVMIIRGKNDLSHGFI